MQSWREVSIAISRKDLRKGEGRFGWDEEDIDGERGEDKVEDIPAGYRTDMAGTVLGFYKGTFNEYKGTFNKYKGTFN